MAPEKCTSVAAQENHVSAVTEDSNDSARKESAGEILHVDGGQSASHSG